MASLVGKFFRHYKGKYYYVNSVSIHTESEEKLVNYYSLYANGKYEFGQMWSRPLTMWNESVDGKDRFTEVDKDDVPVEAYNTFLIQQIHK
jgi:hypothetical protein